MKEESNWLPVLELTHIPKVVFNFHLAYLNKPSLLLLS